MAAEVFSINEWINLNVTAIQHNYREFIHLVNALHSHYILAKYNTDSPLRLQKL